MATRRYRGAGGVVWELDTPRPGSMAAERLAEQIAKGDLKPLDGDPFAVAAPAAPEPEPDVATLDQAPDGGYEPDVATLDEPAPAEPEPEANEDRGPEPPRPRGNASTEEWAAYAAWFGIDVDPGMTRDDIRSLFD